MLDASAAVQITRSGTPFYEEVAKAVTWPTGSTLFSSIVDSVLNVPLTPPRETVFLTRAHQRIMDRALRRSVRIIA